VQERADGEVRRRSRVVQTPPSEASPTRLVGAVLCGRDEGWSGSRFFSDEKISEPCEDRPKPEPPSEERRFVAEQATRASLELADGMEAA
jgi:putative transposase